MIAPVDFGALPARPRRPGQRRHRAAAPRRPALQRRPVGRLHRRPARGLRAHPRPPGQRRALHHRRHPLRLGRRAAVRRLDARSRVGDSAGVEFVCTSVTSNNLKDITGTPPHTTSIAVEEAIKANNRHIKYLDFDNHGFSVLDLTPTRAQMDWYVIGDRADRDTPITWSVSYSTRTGTGRIEQVDGAACDSADRASRRTFLQAGAAGLLFSTAAGAPALAAGSQRKRAYVLVIDGCRPDELDSGLTPHLAALRDGGLRFPRRRVDAGHGDDPQPRDDDDRAAPGPHRRAGELRLRPRSSSAVRDLDQATDIRSDTVIERLNRHGLHDRHGAQQGVPVRRLRRAAPRTAGSRCRRCRSPSTRPTCSRSRRRWRCSRSSTRT